MKSRRNRIVAFFIASTLFLLSGACSKKNIEGTVADPFGKGIEGAEVQILKSQFKAITNGSGKYSIDYVPGAFTVQFSKKGYTTDKLELTIQQQSKFPAALVTLYPIPKTNGFFHLSNTGLTELVSKPVVDQQHNINWPPSSRFVYRMIDNHSAQPNSSPVTIKQGETIFVDTYPNPAALFKLGNNNILQEYTSFWGDRKFIYNGLVQDKSSKVGEEKLLLRTIEIEPGNYAWCGMVEMMFGGKRPDKGLPCFPFIVVAAQSTKK